jgi:hypothetical protein
LGGEREGKMGEGRVDEKRQKEWLGRRAIDFSTGESGRLREVRGGMRRWRW